MHALQGRVGPVLESISCDGMSCNMTAACLSDGKHACLVRWIAGTRIALETLWLRCTRLLDAGAQAFRPS